MRSVSTGSRNKGNYEQTYQVKGSYKLLCTHIERNGQEIIYGGQHIYMPVLNCAVKLTTSTSVDKYFKWYYWTVLRLSSNNPVENYLLVDMILIIHHHKLSKTKTFLRKLVKFSPNYFICLWFQTSLWIYSRLC